jgi:hypothetical protein
MKAGSTLPEHIVLIIRIFGDVLRRDTPARSAPEYEHQLHKKPTIFGSNDAMSVVVFFVISSFVCI